MDGGEVGAIVAGIILYIKVGAAVVIIATCLPLWVWIAAGAVIAVRRFLRWQDSLARRGKWPWLWQWMP